MSSYQSSSIHKLIDLCKIGQKININAASFKQIKQVQGIGQILASRIIENRPYITFDDLQHRVKGIGRKRKISLTTFTQITSQNINPLVNDSKIKAPRTITEAMKRYIAGKQYYKCANKPFTEKYKSLENYNCPLWEKSENKGSFDQSGFEIDHINEFSISQNNTEENLQALCKSCHSVKTKKFLRA